MMGNAIETEIQGSATLNLRGLNGSWRSAIDTTSWTACWVAFRPRLDAGAPVFGIQVNFKLLIARSKH